MKRKLKRNRIRCKHCRDIIESKIIHNFQECKCKAVSIDGVLDYPKRIFSSNSEVNYEELSEYE
ncbi:hypothetical protein EW027_05230 [Aeribacillus pallidus]|uniref:DUF7695 domain-containing protein n=1 Tax=Aeribacillus pallidus TaxID=33936 RepID=UPI00102358E8|nr:hypothetical protein EW027_05230 [Aeribacillus pallidus]